MPNRSFVFSNGIFFVGLLDLAISGSQKWIIDNVRCRSILLMWLGLQNIIIIISLVQNTNNLLLSIIYNLLLRLHCKAFNLQILKWHKFSILNVCGWAISGCKNRLLDYLFNSRLIANTASIANFIKAESMNSCFAKSALEVFFGNSTEKLWAYITFLKQVMDWLMIIVCYAKHYFPQFLFTYFHLLELSQVITKLECRRFDEVWFFFECIFQIAKNPLCSGILLLLFHKILFSLNCSFEIALIFIFYGFFFK